MLPLLVMPAIEPGCYAFHAGPATFTKVRAPFCRPFLVSFTRRSSITVLARRRGPDAGALTFTCAPV
jgi:hypothetical protein